MVQSRTFLSVRNTVFCVTVAFSFAGLILAALIMHFASAYYSKGYPPFVVLGTATSILTFLTLPVMLVLSMSRNAAIPSTISIEIAWTWFLCIMWLSTAGSALEVGWVWECGYGLYPPGVDAFCLKTHALTAFSFLQMPDRANQAQSDNLT